MLEYVLLNTLIYWSIAFIIASYYAYGKFLNVALGSYIILGTYSVVSIIREWLSAESIISIFGLVCIYTLTNMIVIQSFSNEKKRDLFWLIFTLGVAICIENMTNVIYGPNAISIDMRNRKVWILWFILILINIVTIYLFHNSYNGILRKSMTSDINSTRSLGINVNRMFTIFASIAIPFLILLWIIIANEWTLRPTDNLFYLIKGLGIMIMVWVEKKEYMYLWAWIYVFVEYLLFIQRWLPISFKETLILWIILIILITKPEWLFNLKVRKR
jgi:branched-subunit amino acid ABC-type transport system permease component